MVKSWINGFCGILDEGKGWRLPVAGYCHRGLVLDIAWVLYPFLFTHIYYIYVIIYIYIYMYVYIYNFFDLKI